MSLKPFSSIGIGVAFSPNLKANLFEAARLAVFFQSKLVLIHVGNPSEIKTKKLTSFLKTFETDNLDYEIVFKTGEPVDVILSVSKDKKIDLLVLGAAKRERFVTYYMGSIARKITRKVKCSILLLIKPSVERIPCEHIVVNGIKDPKTEQTITTAFYVAKHLMSEKITIVEEIREEYVAVKVDDDKSLRRANIAKERIKLRENQRIKEIVSHIPEDYTKNKIIKLQPIFGKQGYSIGHYAQISRADLLVMNAPSKMTFWDRLFPHDIEHILTELPTDVLILQ
ncbi:Nucleotide-binding universal stress protein, UspA family [Hyunsoonleella jejuensis]|uniref:Nucleotide-binding universal stress protein, UspA family n=1 Tax=Hyunsoonleella jejuensis TaxID=419940 RepID=A0A1H9BFL6_9FLAO|nr:universal stress protein [Hyunsoonleella jejuensis]SEP87772.1 Nucleotide-binding universal stress protein, UspA family [Hyunsoonleella jejuensis]